MSSATVARAAALLLLLLLLALAAATADAACANVVYCLDRMAFYDADYSSPREVTCAVACAGNCCTGTSACDNGRFAVCADAGDGSCDGEEGAPVMADADVRCFPPCLFPSRASSLGSFFSLSQRAILWVMDNAPPDSSPVAAVLVIGVCLS